MAGLCIATSVLHLTWSRLSFVGLGLLFRLSALVRISVEESRHQLAM